MCLFSRSFCSPPPLLFLLLLPFPVHLDSLPVFVPPVDDPLQAMYPASHLRWPIKCRPDLSKPCGSDLFFPAGFQSRQCIEGKKERLHGWEGKRQAGGRRRDWLERVVDLVGRHPRASFLSSLFKQDSLGSNTSQKEWMIPPLLAGSTISQSPDPRGGGGGGGGKGYRMDDSSYQAN